MQHCAASRISLRIGNGVGKQGCGNRPPIDDRNLIRKFSIDWLDASKTNNQTQPQLTRHCRESKRKADTEFQYRPRIVDTDIGTPFLRTPFPRLLIYARYRDRLVGISEENLPLQLQILPCIQSNVHRRYRFWSKAND